MRSNVVIGDASIPSSDEHNHCTSDGSAGSTGSDVLDCSPRDAQGVPCASMSSVGTAIMKGNAGSIETSNSLDFVHNAISSADSQQEKADSSKSMFPIAEEEDLASISSRLAVLEEHLMKAQISEIPEMKGRITDVERSLENLSRIFVKYQQELVGKVTKELAGLKQLVCRQEVGIHGKMLDLESTVEQVAQVIWEIDMERGLFWHRLNIDRQSICMDASVAYTDRMSIPNSPMITASSVDAETHAQIMSLVETARKNIEEVYNDLTVHVNNTQKRFIALEAAIDSQQRELQDASHVCIVESEMSETKRSRVALSLQQVQPTLLSETLSSATMPSKHSKPDESCPGLARIENDNVDSRAADGRDQLEEHAKHPALIGREFDIMLENLGTAFNEMISHIDQPDGQHREDSRETLLRPQPTTDVTTAVSSQSEALRPTPVGIFTRRLLGRTTRNSNSASAGPGAVARSPNTAENQQSLSQTQKLLQTPGKVCIPSSRQAQKVAVT